MNYIYLFLIGYLFGATAQAQTSRYVSTTGTTAPSGAVSWAASTTDLQGAINAVSAGGGGYVYVAQGVYKPGGNANTNRSSSFSMANSVTIVGGYVGNGSPGASVPRSSTLSGEIGNAVSVADNSYHVINNPASLSLNASAVLADVVVTGGNAGENTYPENLGGGMYNNGIGSVCSPTIRNCLFIDNRASTGAGVVSEARQGGISRASFINCSFVNNQADYSAGAMFNNAYAGNADCSPLLINCSFAGNGARFGAGVYNAATDAVCNPTLINCTFTNNQSLQTGGALYNSGFSGQCNPNLFNCSFVDNRSQSGFAGAIFNDGRSGTCLPTLTNCTLRNNYASQQAAALYNTGTGGRCVVVLMNCILWDNGNDGILNSDASVEASYSLFQNNAGYSGLGNIVTFDSPFANTADILLKSCSRAINAGNPASTTAVSAPYSATNLPATDLGGNLRVVGGLVDMGAYEFQGTPDTPTGFTQQPISGSVSCLGSSVSIPVSVSGVAPYYYQWYKDGVALTGIASATTGTLTLTDLSLTDSGSYSVLVNGGCGSARSTVFSLTVTPRATLTVSNSGTLTCAVPTLTLTAGGGVNYAFARVGGGNGLSSQDAASGRAEVNDSGIYSVTVTDSYGCRAALSTTIVSNTAVPAVSLTPSGTITCANTTVTLTASPTGSYTYAFSGGAAQIGSGTTATVNAGGSYSVTVRNADGCTVTASTTVAQNTVTPVASINPASATISCGSSTISLTALGGDSYRWEDNTSSATRTVSTSGVYSVTVTGTNGCTAVAFTTISRRAGDNVAWLSQPAAGSLVCAGRVVTIAVSTTGTGVSYRWYRNGLLVSGQTSATLTLNAQPGDAGNYVAVATGSCNSVTSSAFSLTVTPSPSPTVLFSPATAPAVLLDATGGIYYRIALVITSLNGYQIRQTDENGNGRFTAQKGQSFTLWVKGPNGCDAIVQGRVPD